MVSNDGLGIVPIFRSGLQAELLYLLLASDEEWTTPRLVQATARPQQSVHRELSRLVRGGLVRERRIAQGAIYSIDEANPAVRPLRSLVLMLLGPRELLRSALLGVDGIVYAAIFGSFAARAAGVAGPSPNDIDLVVVGDTDRRDVYEAVSDVQDKVGREVNVTFLDERRWADGVERIVHEIRENDRIELIPG